ncbi:MarR family winged helix-turn-helix transcriptional regulator [Shimia gijangensis]|nr:MarR family transcriptional regulator [Shimia gijangensis]
MTQVPKAKAAREGSFGFLVQLLARDLDARMKEALKEIGVEVKIFANLMMLYEEDGINQRALGERLNFPEYFTSRNIDAMVEAGYVERRQDPNSRRSYLIFLTDKGREKASQLPAKIKAVNDSVLAELTEQEKADVIKLLQKAAKISDGTSS